ncbi:MAG: 3-hydroxyacyl-ACP dehydratase [Desulfobacteraceae bacterium]|nr:MAG: 3-hydroxyacyl-ACP dehydratase [Desulfobacteraceae bacterium]
MKYAGLDIGSRTIELVIIEDGKVVESKQADTGFDPLKQAQTLLDGVKHDRLMATGYGRHLAADAFGAATVTEIKAYAVGARSIFPEARAILDIGGQDSKAISLDQAGNILKFEMNDRCAAGTGKFLEIMAHALGYSMEQFGPAALQGKGALAINSMCTVFAESEVISLIARNEKRENIAQALHQTIVKRALAMIKRVGLHQPLFFAGGVARNVCVHQLLERMIANAVLVPEEPQMTGALGAAWIAAMNEKK